MEGRIRVVNSAGYGFIETPKKIDFFFHHTSYRGDWKALLSRFVKDEILIVDFEIDMTAVDGPRALNVTVKDSIGA